MKTRNPVLCFVLIVLLHLGHRGLWLRVQEQPDALNRQLIDALSKGNTKKALALVNEGADPNTRYYPPSDYTKPSYDDSATALTMACTGGYNPFVKPYPANLELLRAMLTHGADLRLRTDGRYTALDGAVGWNRTRVVALLLAHGADVNVRDPISSTTPLMEAAHANHRAMVRLLLAHGADVNAQDDEGETALHYALEVNYVKELGLEYRVEVKIDKDIVRQLLAHGADPNLANKDGVTPLQYAQQKKRPDIVALLQKGGK